LRQRLVVDNTLMKDTLRPAIAVPAVFRLITSVGATPETGDEE